MSDNPPAKKKVGRPPTFNEVVSAKIFELAKEGKSDNQIAKIIGVHPRTLGVWKQNSQEFYLTLKQMKAAADELVEASLYRRAVGFEVSETKTTTDPTSGQTIVQKTKKQLPPDPTSMIFWLKNRKPQEWRDKLDFEHEGTITHAHVAITPEILKAALTQDAFIETEVTHVEPSSDRTGNNLITSTGNPRNSEEGPLD